MNNNAIFSLRFGSNQKIDPSPEDLALFLRSKKEGTRELQSDDLASYWELLARVAEYKSGGGPHGFQDRLLFTVLSHTQVAKPALKSAVEQYKFHVHSLSMLDFKKPVSFIKSAEEEIGRLNLKKREEASRIERLRQMIEERKQIIEKQKKRWFEIADELSHIIGYISNNLTKITKICENSISILVQEQIERKKEAGLVEDIKSEYKERLREALRLGTITKEQLDAAKDEVAALSKRTADFMRSDIFAMTQLYEAVHDHARKIAAELDQIAGEIADRRHSAYDEDRELYARAERSLISLISGFQFEAKTAEIELDRDPLLAQKRKETIDHLVDLVQKAT